MRLTWRDGVTTVLAAAIGVATFAVVQEWGWPLLGSYRAGAAVLLVMGFAMCALSGSSQVTSMRSPYTIATTVLGGLALALAIWAMIANAQLPFVALAVDTLLLWLVATLHHAVGSPQGGRAALGTP